MDFSTICQRYKQDIIITHIPLPTKPVMTQPLLDGLEPTLYRYVYLNSQHRSKGTNTKFSVPFNSTDFSLNQATEMVVKEIHFANEFYNVFANSGGNTIEVNATAVTISIGHYNTGTLITALEAAILAATGIVVTITQDPITSILSFAAAVPLTLSGDMELLRTIGGVPGTSYGPLVTVALPGPPMLNRPSEVKVYLTGTETNTVESKNNGGTTFLAETVSLANVEYQQFVSKVRDSRDMGLFKFKRDRHLTAIEVELRDNFDVHLTLPPNFEMSVTIQLGFLRHG